jgi:hypothetical protein
MPLGVVLSNGVMLSTAVKASLYKAGGSEIVIALLNPIVLWRWFNAAVFGTLGGVVRPDLAA